MTMRAEGGVSSLAPWAIHFLIRPISKSVSGSLPRGMAGFLPFCGVICVKILLASGLPGTMPAAFALVEQIGIGGHDKAAAGLGELAAPLAVLLQDAAKAR